MHRHLLHVKNLERFVMGSQKIDIVKLIFCKYLQNCVENYVADLVVI